MTRGKYKRLSFFVALSNLFCYNTGNAYLNKTGEALNYAKIFHNGQPCARQSILADR